MLIFFRDNLNLCWTVLMPNRSFRWNYSSFHVLSPSNFTYLGFHLWWSSLKMVNSSLPVSLWLSVNISWISSIVIRVFSSETCLYFNPNFKFSHFILFFCWLLTASFAWLLVTSWRSYSFSTLKCAIYFLRAARKIALCFAHALLIDSIFYFQLLLLFVN